VQKKREWVRKSLCSEEQQATGRESVLTSVVLTCVLLCFLLISCFAWTGVLQGFEFELNWARAIKKVHKKYSLSDNKHFNLKQTM
jgi:hypothetical protein